MPILLYASLCDDNNITLNNAQNGIYSGVLNTAKIKFNVIKINDNSNNSGISVWANRYSRISCNSVTGNYSSGATGNTNGISMGNNSLVGSNTLYCNSVDSTYRGFYFGGQNPSTVFKGNEMNKHWVGLYLNTGAPGNPTFIRTQPHFGNKWNIPSFKWGWRVNLTFLLCTLYFHVLIRIPYWDLFIIPWLFQAIGLIQQMEVQLILVTPLLCAATPRLLSRILPLPGSLPKALLMPKKPQKKQEL
ncbi:MAG: right-handed parallel beta-helix repeat-containing protein [Bacteroidetes bacterium]|nr:right-handed parallel beta-helix repeat-containing protein [Bacteroidota bacterium]